MGWYTLLALALALAMDAFAVAIAASVTLKEITRRHVFRLSFHFGLFQSLMLVLGWFTGAAVHRYVAGRASWIACGFLAFVGARMVWGALRGGEERAASDPTAGWDLVILSVATSVDALAVGLSLAMVGTAIAGPALVIGIVATALTLLGMGIGRQVGMLWGKRVEILGGVGLIAIGLNMVR